MTVFDAISNTWHAFLQRGCRCRLRNLVFQDGSTRRTAERGVIEGVLRCRICHRMHYARFRGGRVVRVVRAGAETKA